MLQVLAVVALAGVVGPAVASEVCAPVSEEAREAARDELEDAQARIVAQDWPSAEALLREALRVDPGRGLAHYGLGQALLAQERPAEAVEAFRRSREAFRCVLSLPPEERRAVERERARQIRRLKDALANLERVGPVLPQVKGQAVNTRQPMPTHGERLRAVREIEDRLDELERASVARDPAPPFVTFALGTALFQAGDLEGSEAELRSAVAADPGSGDAHNNLALVLMLNGRLEEAQREAERAVELGVPVHPRLFDEIEKRRERPRP